MSTAAEVERKKAFEKIMESDSSGANVHAIFVNYCRHGGWAFTGQLCRNLPVAFICISGCHTRHCLSEIATHEIGHLMGN